MYNIHWLMGVQQWRRNPGGLWGNLLQFTDGLQEILQRAHVGNMASNVALVRGHEVSW